MREDMPLLGISGPICLSGEQIKLRADSPKSRFAKEPTSQAVFPHARVVERL